MEEKRDKTLKFLEDEFREGAEGRRKILPERKAELKPSETAGEGDSSIEGGLRRRFVSIGETLERKDQTGSLATKCETVGFFKERCSRVDVGRFKSHGSTLRRILESEMPSRGQPSKSKKKRKKRHSEWVQLKKRRSQTGITGDSSIIIGTFKRTNRNKVKIFKDFREFILPSVWKTGDELFDSDQAEEALPIIILRDFILYLLFLIVVWLVTFGTKCSAYNFYSDVYQRLITNSSYNSSLGSKISFEDTQFPVDMWTFILDVVCAVLYDKTLVDKTSNVYFGAPRLRQLRVRGKTCSSAPMFQSLYADCADYYSEGIEDKDDFGPKTSAWKYSPHRGAQSYFTGVVSTYPEGGFVMNFTADEEFTRSFISQLRDENWVRFGTRAVFIEFVVFNPSTQLFCACKVLFEFPPFGGIIPSFSSSTLKLLKYETPSDYFILCFEIIFICFTILYTMEESLQIYRLRETYLSNWWNIVDILILIFCYFAIILGIISDVKSRNFVKRNLDSIYSTNHVSFSEIVGIQTLFEELMTVILFVTGLKILKFATLSRKVSTMLAAISRIKWFLITVTAMLAVLLMGSAVASFVILTPLLNGFNSVGESFITMAQLIAGGVNFWKYDSYHALSNFGMVWGVLILGTIFFLLIRLVVLNLYVALIVIGLQEEVMEINFIAPKTTIADILREFFCTFLRFIRYDETAERITHRETIKYYIKIYNALVRILNRHGFEDLEVDLLMEKHRIICGFQISEDSMCDLYNDIHARKQLSLEVEEHGKLEEKINLVVANILMMEQTHMELLTKIDIITDLRIMRKKNSTLS